MSDHLDRAAEVLWEATCPDGLRAAMRPDCWAMAQALDAAGLLVSPERDAEVAAKALRIVESVCMTTDGDHLEGESEIPVGEVMRMILEVDEAFGIEREAGESDADA